MDKETNKKLNKDLPIFWSDYIGISIANGVVKMGFEANGIGQCVVVLPIEEFTEMIRQMNTEGWKSQLSNSKVEE